MFCPNCGNDMGNIEVCARCGTVVDMSKVVQPQGAQVWGAGGQAPAGNDGMPIWGTGNPSQTGNGKIAQGVQPWGAGNPGQMGNDRMAQGAQSRDAGRPAWENGAQAQPEQGMKWYKFVIYFQLYCAAIVSAGMAVAFFAGLQYGQLGESAGLMYMMYGPLQALDIFMGVASLGAVIWSLYVRRRLRWFKKDASLIYLLFLIMVGVVNFVYTVLAGVIIGRSLVDCIASGASALVFQMIAVVLNYIYFKKRKHLFVG